jgi:hypothetical protein
MEGYPKRKHRLTTNLTAKKNAIRRVAFAALLRQSVFLQFERPPSGRPSLYSFGAGIGSERIAGGSTTARKRTGGDFQPNGVAGNVGVHGVKRLRPSVFWSSNTMPGRAMRSHSCQWAIAIQSVIEPSPVPTVHAKGRADH